MIKASLQDRVAAQITPSKDVRCSASMKGFVTVQLEDQDGRILKKETKENAITDPFLHRMLSAVMSTAPISTVMRGISKTGTNGQYFSAVHSGTWGVYAMNNAVPVTKKMKIPPYIDAYNTLAPSVAFYNVNCSTAESFNQMLAADQNSGYSITPGKNEMEVTYVKNTGTGTVRSVVFGRDFASPLGVVGSVLGECWHQANWITGRAGSSIEHKLGHTRVWKTNSTATGAARFLDLNTKEIALDPGVSGFADGWTMANIGGAISTAATTGAGSLVVNNRLFRVDYTSNVAGTSVTCTINRWFNATSPTTRTFTFPIAEGTTYNTSFLPVNVFNPLTGNLEVFMVTGTNANGAHVQKAVISNIHAANMTDMVVTIEDLGMKFGPVPGGMTQYLSLGFCDHETSQYWLPCPYSIGEGGRLITRSDASFCPGYVFDDEWNIVDEWIARSTGSGTPGGAITPVRTDVGIALMLYDLATPYYVQIGQVISGAVLSEPFVKRANDVLRIIYTYRQV